VFSVEQTVFNCNTAQKDICITIKRDRNFCYDISQQLCNIQEEHTEGKENIDGAGLYLDRNTFRNHALFFRMMSGLHSKLPK
jgi:hypothetical protein